MMNKTVFVFNGCSQTAGKEVLKDDPTATDDVTRNHSWAKHFQMQMNPNAEFVNLARSGASNESIFRYTVDWLANNQDKLQDTFVAVMWTEPNRFEFEFLGGDRKDVIAASTEYRNAEDKYLNKFANEYLANKELTCIKTLNLMLSLEGILTTLGVPFIFLNGFNFGHFYNSYLVQSSDFFKLSKFKGKANLLNDEYCFYKTLVDQFEHTKYLHFYEDAHKYYANYIFTRLGAMV